MQRRRKNSVPRQWETCMGGSMILWFVSHHGLTTETRELAFQYAKTKLKDHTKTMGNECMEEEDWN